ncbi:hypothetical protein [Terrimonas pollutisoli]|uniref:hypothetical protein n=1 Tax=Terrimonas pollutisoli TaxID=3034147 RepID=UPI0023EC99AB|nr:hypothetical protein [Terrimonas sp. H1YJ31]
MPYPIKTFLLAITLFAVNQTNAQESQRIYSFKQVGWTIELPPGFEVMDSSQNTARMERGLKALEEANDITADVSGTITLIGATKNKFNYFNATIERFNPRTDGSWQASNQQLKDMVYATFAEKMKDATIDTASGKAKIDGVSFDKFRITVKVGDRVLFNSFLLSKFYKGYNFGISYLYLDERTKEEIESMLEKSKFIK